MKRPSAKCRLLSTAASLFGKKCYSEVGIDEIIKKSDTAKATFYRHYPSKDLLVEAWLMAIHEGAVDRQQVILDADGCSIDKIQDSFDALAGYMVKNDFRGCPYSNSCAVTEPGNNIIRQQIEIHKLSSRRFYAKLCESITETQAQAVALGDQIFILYSGATTEAQNLRELWPIQVAKRAALSMCQRIS